MPPHPVAEFITDYPALAIPLSLLIYLMLYLARREVSREFMYIIAAAPGLIIAWSWIFLTVDGPPFALLSLLISSVLAIPTNIICPVLVIVMSISILRKPHVDYSHSPDFRTIDVFDVISLSLIILAYGYDQLISIGLQNYAETAS